MKTLNIVIGTHGRFGEELVRSAEMIVGKMDNVNTVSLDPEASFETYMQEADALLSTLVGPIITLVDLFGGTPSNVFTVLSKKHGNAVITGLNLPMLVDLYLSTNHADAIDVSISAQRCLDALSESGTWTNQKLD